MYLHIGKDIVVKEEDVIGIFDIESIKDSLGYDKILKKLEKNIINISNDINKTLILVKEKKVLKGYISNISSLTLCRRTDNG